MGNTIQIYKAAHKHIQFSYHFQTVTTRTEIRLQKEKEMNACYLIPIAVYLLSSCSIIQSAPINNPMLTPQFNTIVPVGGGTPVGASGDLTPSEVNQYCIGGDKSAIPSASHSIGQAQTLLHSVMATLVQGIETATEWKTSCNEMQPVSEYRQYNYAK